MIQRYSRDEMNKIWRIENKFQKWLEVEIYACEAWAELGFVPLDDLKKIKEKATFTVERIEEIEKETRHDVVAFTRCLAENLDEEARFVHYGLTSSDVVDTALSAQLQEAASLIQEGITQLEKVLYEQALAHKETVMMGRTHGVHAEPTSLGLKFALWYSDLQNNKERLTRAKESIRYGKLSGAVGNYALIDPYVEEYVCRKLNLKVAPISTQILQRDGHAEFIFILSLIAAGLEKIALEFRNLQRTEIREIEEPFYKGQKGSSAMPHKRNPVQCERITGLSRILRSQVPTALENVSLWHERDISHSSIERINLPGATTLVDYMIHQMIRVIKNMHVYPDNMLRNIHQTQGLVFSQRVLLQLINKGLPREEAYDIVQESALKAWETGKSFKEILSKNQNLFNVLDQEELENCFNPNFYLRQTSLIYERLGLE